MTISSPSIRSCFALALWACVIGCTPLEDETAPSARLVVTHPEGVIDENGQEAVMTVALWARPTGTVHVIVETSDATEAVIRNGELTFDETNHDVPQSFWIRGLPDDVDDGDVPFKIHVSVKDSEDPAYAQAPRVTVPAVNKDAVAMFRVSINDETWEDGRFLGWIHLQPRRAPTAPVTIRAFSLNEEEGVVVTRSLTFDPSNWNTNQEIKVEGIDDDVDDGDASYVVRFEAVESADPAYAAARLPDISFTNKDDDSAGFVTTSGGPTHVFGGVSSFSVVMTSKPRSNVKVPFHSMHGNIATPLPSELTFTPENWNVAQTVAIHGLFHQEIDVWRVEFSPAISEDAAYAGVVAPFVRDRHRFASYTTVTATHRGHWTDLGQHPVSDDIVVGTRVSGVRQNGYATFKVDPRTIPGTIYSADLLITGHYMPGIPTGRMNFQINHVSTLPALVHGAPVSPASGKAIFDDLGNGVVYGRYSFRYPETGTTASLNSALLAPIRAGSELALGFTCTDCGEAGKEAVFLMNGAGTPKLRLGYIYTGSP